MKLVFWGTRGTVVAPGAGTVRYGGNTPCVQVLGTEEPFILDAGMGLVLYGEHVMKMPKEQHPTIFHIFFSHLHWDHVQGLPFFVPIYLPGREIHFYGRDPSSVEDTVHRLFESPYSPIQGVANLGAKLHFYRVDQEGTELEQAKIRCAATCHPHPNPESPTIAYRVSLDGRDFVYATDHEAGLDAEADARVIALAQGANTLIHDAFYKPEKYAHHVGWGHSSFEQAVRIAAEARVGRLVLFHHHPSDNDSRMDENLARAKEMAPDGLEVIAAMDQQILTI